MNLNIFKRKHKETFLDFILNILGCWLISVGTSLVVDAQFSIEIGLKSILWQTLFAVIAAVLFTRKWWIPIIYFGILVPVFFLAISLTGDINTFFDSFASFVDWWVKGMSYDSKWYTDQGFYLVHTFMNIGIGILYFAVVRIFKSSLVVVGVVITFLVVNYAYGHTGYSIWAIPFLVAGVFPLVAGERFQNVKLPDIKNLFGVFGKKWLLVFVSTIISIVICALSINIATNNDGSVRNRFCSDAVADLQTISGTYTKEQKKLNITLFDLGLVMNSTYIGGNLYNIKPKPLAATNLSNPTLIKVTSFDNYDGIMWSNEFDKSYRVNGFWDNKQNSYFAGTALSREYYLENLEKIVKKSNVTITLAQDMFYLPITGQVIEFNEQTQTTNPVLYDRRGRLFSYYGFEKGYEYSFETINFDTNNKVLATQIKRFYNKMNFEKDPLYDKNGDFYKCYTQLPEDVPKDIDNALKKIITKNKNEFEIAAQIANYFSSENGFVYVKEPNNFQRGDDIVECLFSTKKGHCMYYATAMVMMARKVGIPSRLAAGYKTIKNPNGKLQIIDASSPYAWVECYVPNIGWVTFDPVPDVTLKPNNADKNRVPLNNQTLIPDVEVDAETEKEEQRVAGTHLKWNHTFSIPLIVLIVLLGLAVLSFVLNTVLSQKYYEIESVRKRFKSTTMQVEYYYRDVLRQFVWLGFRFKKGETLKELTLRACKKLPETYVDGVLLAMVTVEELHYGDIEPTEDGVLALQRARADLEKVLSDRNNKVFYVLKRRTLLPIFFFNIKKKK